MPLVVVHYKPDIIPEDMTLDLAMELPNVIADALDVEGNADARLSPSDVEIQFLVFGEHDVNVKDLEIVVWANLYPERLANLEERKDMILGAVREISAHYDFIISGFVWVLLSPAAFGEL